MGQHTPTRRDVLKTTTAVTAISGLPTAVGSAESPPNVPVIEAGVRYDVPAGEQLHTISSDSRPGYTVATAENRLLVDEQNGRGGRFAQKVAAAGALIAERPTEPGTSKRFGPREESRILPVGLTTRHRPRGGVLLAEAFRHPRVMVRRTGNSGVLIVSGERNRQIDPESTETVRLTPRTVVAKTVQKTDELVDRPDIPEYRRARKTVAGTREIEVEPVVELTHRGELGVETY